MRLKRTHALYAAFFVMSLIIFVAVNENPEWGMKKHSDAILIFLITVLSVFIIHGDFRKQLPILRMAMPGFIFILTNVTIIFVIYFIRMSPSVGIIIPFFMTEGAIVYWWIETRISTLDD